MDLVDASFEHRLLLFQTMGVVDSLHVGNSLEVLDRVSLHFLDHNALIQAEELDIRVLQGSIKQNQKVVAQHEKGVCF